MAEDDLPAPRRRSLRVPLALLAVSTLTAAQAALWLSLRKAQPQVDRRTRDRLQPRRRP